MSFSRKVKVATTVTRWIILIPGAVFSSWLVFFLSELISRLFSFLNGYNPNSNLDYCWRLLITHFLMGYAFVYIGTYIAPIEENSNTPYILASIGLVFIGLFIFPAIILINFSAIWGCIACIIGLCFSTYEIVNK